MAARRYAPVDEFSIETKMCVSSRIQQSRRIYVRPRTGPQSAHLWWPTVAKLQAASAPKQLRCGTDRRTDRSPRSGNITTASARVCVSWSYCSGTSLSSGGRAKPTYQRFCCRSISTTLPRYQPASLPPPTTTSLRWWKPTSAARCRRCCRARSAVRSECRDPRDISSRTN